MSTREELLALPIVVPPNGLVPLIEKQGPAYLSVEDKEDYAFTRAIVDNTPMKEKLLNNPELFDENYQCQNGQPHVTRPAHDEWGIGKIVFVFCDDFLKRVYAFPWWQSKEWRDLIDPYLNAIGVPDHKVVRCLLAKMPAEATIPIHHDTGFWVPKTHRVHVPIVTGEHVIFRVGKTADTMKRYSFDEGRIVELNNQAKHAVDNFMDQERIHLIFDYVDDYPIERIVLEPGTKLRQTRRSIDLALDAGTRKSPTFLVIGAQKSGTTSLYEYLCAHPLVVPGKGRESHYFDWRWNEKLKTAEEHHRYYMGWYEHQLLHHHPSLMTGESTPSYMLYSHLTLPRIKEVCPWAKLLVILRDPVARAYSQYQMMADPEGTPQQKKNRGTLAAGRSFEEVIDIEMKELEDHGITPTCSREQFVEYIKTRPMDHGGHSILARGMYAQLLQPWLNAYGEDQLLVLYLDDLKANVQSTMERVYDFVGLPPQHVLENQEPRNTRSYSTLSAETLARLKAFFQPYNDRLRDMLGSLPASWN